MRSTDINKSLQAAVAITGAQVRFTPEEVSVSYMSAGGAMEILMMQFDTDTILLVGIWRSDVMLLYLHTSYQGLNWASRRASPNTGTMRSSHPPTGSSTPFPQVWASPRPLLGSSLGAGIGLVSIWQIKHALLHNHTPLTVARSNH